jgi:hypothetical protein
MYMYLGYASRSSPRGTHLTWKPRGIRLTWKPRITWKPRSMTWKPRGTRLTWKPRGMTWKRRGVRQAWNTPMRLRVLWAGGRQREWSVASSTSGAITSGAIPLARLPLARYLWRDYLWRDDVNDFIESSAEHAGVAGPSASRRRTSHKRVARQRRPSSPTEPNSTEPNSISFPPTGYLRIPFPLMLLNKKRHRSLGN